MLAVNRKYNLAATIDGCALSTKDTMNLRVTPTLAAGDVKVSKDGGTLANLTTLPVETPSGSGLLRVSLSAAEMSAARIVVAFVDQTVPKEWNDDVLLIETFGHASAQTPPDYADATRLGLAALPNAAFAAGVGSLGTLTHWAGTVSASPAPTSTTVYLGNGGPSNANYPNGLQIRFATSKLTGIITAYAPNAGNAQATIAGLAGVPQTGEPWEILSVRGAVSGTDGRSLVSSDAHAAGATVAAVTGSVGGTVTLAAAQPGYAPARAGDAMALTGAERAALRAEIDANSTRLAVIVGDTGQIQTNQSTIINRLGAFTGSGVNTVLGLLRAALRSDAATPSDVGGTYDPATDSLQAVRDRGDAAWTTGTGGGGGGFVGANAVTLRFKDATGALVPGVAFTVAGVGSAAAGDGTFTGGLNAGTFGVVAAPHAGVLFAPATIVVSGPGTFDVVGSAAAAVAPAASPAQTTGYIYTRDGGGAIRAGLDVVVQLVDPSPNGSGGADAWERQNRYATSDAAGLAQLPLAKGATYRHKLTRNAKGWSGPFAVPADAGQTFQMPELLGPEGS